MYPNLRQKGIFMNASRTIKNWLIDGCIYYTAISGCFLLLNFFMGDLSNSAISTVSFFLMIPCGLTVSVGTQFLRAKNMARWARNLLHYAFTTMAVLFFLILPADSAATPMTNFLMLLFFSIVYWLVFWLVSVLYRQFKKHS